MSGVGATGQSGAESEILKEDLLCASDLKRDFTWQEIDGVRRVVQIVFTSVIIDIEVGSTVTLTRNFNYEVADPFDLDFIQDVLVVA